MLDDVRMKECLAQLGEGARERVQDVGTLGSMYFLENLGLPPELLENARTAVRIDRERGPPSGGSHVTGIRFFVKPTWDVLQLDRIQDYMLTALQKYVQWLIGTSHRRTGSYLQIGEIKEAAWSVDPAGLEDWIWSVFLAHESFGLPAAGDAAVLEPTRHGRLQRESRDRAITGMVHALGPWMADPGQRVTIYPLLDHRDPYNQYCPFVVCGHRMFFVLEKVWIR